MSDFTGPRKCDPKKNEICGVMLGHFTGLANEQTRGFVPWYTSNFKTRQLHNKFLGVSYHMSKKDKGLFLKWCPFCGVNIDPVKGKRATIQKESK